MTRVTGGLIASSVFAAALLATLGMDGSLHYPLAYPQALIAAVALLFLASAARDWRAARGGDVDDIPATAPDAVGGPIILWVTIALCVAYAASWTLIGFLPATFLYIAAQLWLLRQKYWGVLFGMPAVVTLVVHVVFARLLALSFPVGPWFG